MNYIYRFLNENNEIIYIGKTTQENVKRRLYCHFSSGHLPKECYEDVAKVECTEIKSDSSLVVYEPYLINVYKPKYNSDLKRNDELNITLPELEWFEVELRYLNKKDEKDEKTKRKELEEYLNKICEERLFKEEQKELINKIDLKDGHGRLLKSISFMNEYLEDNGYNYFITKPPRINYIDENGQRKKESTSWKVIHI